MLSIPVAGSPQPNSTPLERIPHLFERINEEVDLRLFFPFSPDARDFGRYWLDHCINPEHTDRSKSMLVYSDGCHCTACGFRSSTLSLYRGHNPQLSFIQAAQELLSGKFKLTARYAPKAERQLDHDTAVKNHLRLGSTADALDEMRGFGFTDLTIRTAPLGLADVLVPLELEEAQQVTDIEWRTRPSGQKVPYQWQSRFSVPVFSSGRLVQMVYRRRAGSLGPKTTMEWGAGRHLYNGDALDKMPELVYIVSGWGDVLTLAQWNIVGVSGINGDGCFEPEWFTRVTFSKRVYVIGDRDTAGQRFVTKVQKAIPWARPVELPFVLGGELKDVRDFSRTGNTQEQFLQLQKAADLKRRLYGGLR